MTVGTGMADGVCARLGASFAGLSSALKALRVNTWGTLRLLVIAIAPAPASKDLEFTSARALSSTLVIPESKPCRTQAEEMFREPRFRDETSKVDPDLWGFYEIGIVFWKGTDGSWTLRLFCHASFTPFNLP